MKKPKILHLNSIRNSQRGVTHKLNLKRLFGVNTLAQWVKNLTAGAWVTAEVHVQTPTWHSGIKDPALPQCQHQWPLWPRLYFSLSDAFSRLQVISSLCFFVCSSLLFSLWFWIFTTYSLFLLLFSFEFKTRGNCDSIFTLRLEIDLGVWNDRVHWLAGHPNSEKVLLQTTL